jgi:hypothetical protein
VINVNQIEDNTIYKRIIQGLNIDVVVQAILKTLNYHIQHYTETKKLINIWVRNCDRVGECLLLAIRRNSHLTEW